MEAQLQASPQVPARSGSLAKAAEEVRVLNQRRGDGCWLSIRPPAHNQEEVVSCAQEARERQAEGRWQVLSTHSTPRRAWVLSTPLVSSIAEN